MIAGLLAGGTQFAAGEERQDTGVLPPLTGVAVARATGGQGAEWTLAVTLLKPVWHAVAPAMPRKEWPQVTWERIPRSTESLGTMIFSLGGSADAALCTVVDLEGREVGRDRVLKELETEKRLLVSVSGRIPEPRYRRLPSQAELIVVLGPEARRAPRTSTPDAEDRAADEEPEPNSWAEQESQEYFFGLMEKGKSFRVGSETEARRYLEGLWRLDRRAHVGDGHYIHADRGDDVTVICTDAWLVTTVFNHHEIRVAESAHRIKTLTLKSDGHIVVNGSERFKPLDDDHMAMLGYDFIAVVQRAR